MFTSQYCQSVTAFVVFGAVLAAPATATDVIVERNGPLNELRWSGGGAFFT